MPNTLTIVERQILANQFRILAEIEENGEHHITSAEIIENGYTGQYHSALNVDREEVPIDICDETSEILNMYRRINNAIAGLTEEQRDGLNLESIRFEGFDANNDSHYHYMTFMVEKMDLWQEHNGNYLNSHSQFPLQKYRRMLVYQRELLSQQNWNIGLAEIEHFISLV